MEKNKSAQKERSDYGHPFGGVGGKGCALVKFIK